MGRENYCLEELLHDGCFWTAFKARCKSTGRSVEMKFITRNGPIQHFFELNQEVQKHRKLKHANIIEMLDCFENKDEFCIVTEFVQAKRVSKIIKDQISLSVEDVQPLAKQLVRAMCYLHSNGITYHNLLPQDILICEGPLVVKICGFGFLRFRSLISLPTRAEEYFLYMAPDVMKIEPCQATADLWSLGVILYQLVLGKSPFRVPGRTPFHGKDMYILVQDIKKGQIEYPGEQNMRSDLQSFISGLLKKEPIERLNWADVLQHQFVKETPEEPEAKEISAETAEEKGYNAGLGGETNVPSPAEWSGTSLGEALEALKIKSQSDASAKSIGKESGNVSVILLPLRSWSSEVEQVSNRDEDIVLNSNKSLYILANIVAAGGLFTSGVVHEIAHALLEFRDIIVKMAPKYNGLMAKSFLIIVKLFEYYTMAMSYRDRWRSSLQLCANGIPRLLFGLLSDNCEKGYSNLGLSPVEIVWTVSSLSKFVSKRLSAFGRIIIECENTKLILDLMSDAHLEYVRCLEVIGGGKKGLIDMINAVIDLLALPFSARPNAISDDGDTISGKDIVDDDFRKYTELLAEVKVPETVLRCLAYRNMEDVEKPLTFLAKLTCQRIFANQLLSINIFDPSIVGKYLTVACPGEVTSEVLMIVSNIAYWFEKFYEQIDRAGMLEYLKACLTHEDSKVHANTCRAIGNMCQHSSFFYNDLAKHGILGVLIEQCSNPDELTKGNACSAIDNMFEKMKVFLSHKDSKVRAKTCLAIHNMCQHGTYFFAHLVKHGVDSVLLDLSANDPDELTKKIAGSAVKFLSDMILQEDLPQPGLSKRKFQKKECDGGQKKRC